MPASIFYKTTYRLLYRVHRRYCALFRPFVQGAYVVCIYEDEVLLIKNSYKYYWTIPCGGIDKNEHPKEAALREVEEEVGIVLEHDKLESVGKIVTQADYKNDHIHLFAYRFSYKPHVFIDYKEVERYQWVKRSQLSNINIFRPIVPIIEVLLR